MFFFGVLGSTPEYSGVVHVFSEYSGVLLSTPEQLQSTPEQFMFFGVTQVTPEQCVFLCFTHGQHVTHG